MSLNHDQAKVIRLAVKHKTLEFNNAGLENHPFNANTYEIYIIFVCLGFFLKKKTLL